MDRDRKVISWRMMALFAAVMLIVFAVLMVNSRQRLERLEMQEKQQQVQLASMEQLYAELQEEQRSVNSEGYVENKAREEYGFIKEGEICFEFTNPKKLQDYTAEEWQVILDEKLYNQ